MKDKSIEVIASNLTQAFYAGLEPRTPYFGQERRTIPNSNTQDDRIPSLSIDEVFYVYSRFLLLLEEQEQPTK